MYILKINLSIFHHYLSWVLWADLQEHKLKYSYTCSVTLLRKIPRYVDSDQQDSIMNSWRFKVLAAIIKCHNSIVAQPWHKICLLSKRKTLLGSEVGVFIMSSFSSLSSGDLLHLYTWGGGALV